MAASAPFAIVVFGGSGDLALRKLLPALYHRHRDGQLPAEGRIIGAARSPMDRADYLAFVEAGLRRRLADAFDPNAWECFARRLDYVPLEMTEAADYRRLAEALRGTESHVRVFYLATLPDLYAAICEHLARAGLVTPAARVVLEKPIGRDLASSRQINERVGAVFSEGQIYRMDHYLAKETVQNLLVLRFGNVLFESQWRHKWISHVQITVAEQIGVENRGHYYDRAGALRDMVQNHLLQLLCLLAMEPPNSTKPDAVRDEKLKVLHALRPIIGREVALKTVRGQYRAGSVNGAAVPGYLQEPGIAADSRTETYVALKAEIANWRWAGVPFYLRTGKRLQEQVSEIVVYFREVPHQIFNHRADLPEANHLVIRLQPDESIKLFLMAKAPGDAMRLRPVHLDLNLRETFKTRQPDAYERLLMDVINGRLTLFMRRDEVDAAWGWVEPVLHAWESQDDPPRPYLAGTWGPAAATTLIGHDGFSWREEG
ncbi:MAG: glucose-6-phosphate dehydrogenase [Pseudomonadota bacterium]|nr:glucose-6-phosphate dehydrogenase [Pseudomonadota bacterium]